MRFELITEDFQGRRERIIFLLVESLTSEEIQTAGAEIVLGNAFYLTRD